MTTPAPAPARSILLVNGPNLNLLGTREPHIYGSTTLADVEEMTRKAAAEHGIEVRCVQSNHEGVLLDAIHEARNRDLGIIINPGAFTHTSVALHDALAAVEVPTVEVHISNIHKREAFRHHSYVSSVAEAVIAGAGTRGYLMAVDYLANR
jgi:3-dehydroquinate dehydratase II